MAASRWIQAATDNDEDDRRQPGSKGFRRIARKAGGKHEEPDADDKDRKKKRGGIVEAMNEPMEV